MRVREEEEGKQTSCGLSSVWIKNDGFDSEERESGGTWFGGSCSWKRGQHVASSVDLIISKTINEITTRMR